MTASYDFTGQNGITRLRIVNGDITNIAADALLATLNPGRDWHGGINASIKRVADNKYHDQAAGAMPLSDLQAVIAKGDKFTHHGKFKDVVFVADALESPLSEVIFAGLQASHFAGYRSLLIPAVRTGIAQGIAEKMKALAVGNLAKGIERFDRAYGQRTSLEDVTIVSFYDPTMLQLLKERFAGMRPN